MTENDSEPKQYIDDQEYYHGFVSRKHIIPLLREPGDFVVRVTEIYWATLLLSLMLENKKVYHLRILYDDGHWVLWCELMTKKRNAHFKTIIELVEYYKTHDLAKRTKLKRGIMRPNWMIKHESVVLNRETDMIERGNFGVIYKGQFDDDGVVIPVAVKFCHKQKISLAGHETEGRDARKIMLDEADLLRHFRHRNIIQTFGVAYDHPPVLSLMEFCPGGNLEMHLKKSGDNISCGERLLYATDVARGIRYLHSQKCVHRNLTARNCLISSNGMIKITHFELSIILKGDDGNIKDIGRISHIPLRWMAPESLSEAMEFSTKSDCWSFGILLYEIFNNGIKPWADEYDWPHGRIFTQIRHGEMPEMPDETPEEVSVLCKSIWTVDPEKRPTMKSIFAQLSNLWENYELPEPDNLSINEIEGVWREQESFSNRH